MRKKKIESKSEIRPALTFGNRFYFGIMYIQFIGICNGNRIAAELLYYLYYTHNLKVNAINEAKRLKKPVPPGGEWQFQTDEDVSKRLLVSERTIRRAFKFLSEAGFITIHSYGINPKT